MSKEREEDKKDSLLKEIKTQHFLLWTKDHFLASDETPPEIFSREQRNVPLIALLSPEEICHTIVSLIEPPFANYKELAKKMSEKEISQWTKQLARFPQVLDWLAKTNTFSQEELAKLKEKWSKTLSKLGIEAIFWRRF